MVLASKAFAVLDLHHLPGPRMKRIEDQNLERRTPGIVTLSRPAPARVGWRRHSAIKPVVENGWRVLYHRVPANSSADLALARGDGRYARILGSLGGAQLLILDDWGLEPLDAAARHDLLEILEERYGRRSTIITSQIPVDKWHDIIGNPTYADAILNRLVHNAHRINLTGHSLRRVRASKTSKE